MLLTALPNPVGPRDTRLIKFREFVPTDLESPRQACEYFAFFLPKDKSEEVLGDLEEWYPKAREKFHPLLVRLLLCYHVISWFQLRIRWLFGRLAALGVLRWLFDVVRKMGLGG